LGLEPLQLYDGSDVIEVPRRELALLATLAEASGGAVSKSALLDRMYGAGSETDPQVIEVYVSRLRKRLHRYGLRIQVQRGIGYLLTCPI